MLNAGLNWNFYFLLKVKEDPIVSKNLGYSLDKPFAKFETLQKVASKQLSNVFGSYTQALNKIYDRQVGID